MSTAFEKRLATLAQAQCNYLRTIGGNESDSVGMKEVRLDADVWSRIRLVCTFL